MTDFNLKYEDVLLDRPKLVNLIESAIKGSFVGVDVDGAFEGLKPAQKTYFAKLLTKIWSKVQKKKRADKKAAMLKALDEETKSAPVWEILPKEDKKAA